jgi:tRNA (mo5U34)-methyltransferase
MNVAKEIWTHPENEGAGPDYPAWRWNVLQSLFPEVREKSCLDVGCSSGFFSLKMKELGAREVLGIDQGEQIRAIEQARFAAATTGLEVDFRPMSAYDIHTLGRQFDLVLFLGVFYHLRHPLLALESIRKVCNGTLLMQTITTPHNPGTYEPCPQPANVDTSLRSSALNQPEFPSLRFVEGGLDGDTSCWFIPSVEAVLAMLRSSGFRPERMIRPTAHEVIVRASAT